MKLIPLTQGLFALVDDADYIIQDQFKWYAHKEGNTYYARRQVTIEGKHKMLRLHRVIMNTPDGKEVDHIDHNGLNCLRINMRNCSRKENGRNIRARGKSKYLGVYFTTSHHYIRMSILVKNKRINKGPFKTEEAAAKVYDKLSKKANPYFIHKKKYGF